MTRNRDGFTLVEIIVAMGILAMFLVGIAKANFLIMRRLSAMSGGGAREAILVQLENQFTAMPFDSLASRAGTTTISTGALPYTRKITIGSIASNRCLVTIVITPTNTLFKPDTVVFQRSKPTTSPLGT